MLELQPALGLDERLDPRDRHGQRHGAAVRRIDDDADGPVSSVSSRHAASTTRSNPREQRQRGSGEQVDGACLHPAPCTIEAWRRREEAATLAPSWAAPLYLVLAVLLIPWIVYLGLALPERATSSHWDIAWVGFDAMEFAALALTGWFAYIRSTWIEVAATAAAVMLLVDAWFDVTTANGGWDMAQAVILGRRDRAAAGRPLAVAGPPCRARTTPPAPTLCPPPQATEPAESLESRSSNSADAVAGSTSPEPLVPLFSSPQDVRERLGRTGYLTDDAIATTVFLADALGKPLLVEGPAGTGKTELAKAVTEAASAELVRLQCYEGLDEARALYEWNYRKQLLRIQAAGDGQKWEETHDDIFSEEFLLARPLLTAIRREDPTVLLVDETDKADVEVEGLLLEVLSDFQVTVPELGTIVATQKPFVVLTSNATRELSEALKRRCLFLHMDYPDAERERQIVLTRVPEVPEKLAEQLVRTIRTLRALELKKAPSIAESIDWARTLVALNADELDEATVASTLGVVLKHASDQTRAAKELGLSGG